MNSDKVGGLPVVYSVHVRIGRMVAGELRERNIRMGRKLFLIGCVFPDFLPHFPGHSVDKSKKLFDRLYRLYTRRRGRLCSKIKAGDSFLMGVLSHYAADYACAAHQPDYGENMRCHMRYERDMWRFLKRNPQVIFSGVGQTAASAGFAGDLSRAADAVRTVCAAGG